ncbi:hypothetical protein BAE44_0020712 [Dichanthelium oligosanthes]|uniref:DUF4220 domain-containing protein n=1 Tax=Dichanthelium oligosanthes TaxID=888268 RepID=A0A1E5UZD9_9POAL|nr:hypothetical protein BAE44_0020712 [Dichanthelium oligosanthes]
MVEGSDGALLCSNGMGSRNLKDLCVSFALFKQLLRRFTGCHPTLGPRSRSVRNSILNCDKWLNGRPERASHIIEMELGFLFDFFYARHPSLTQTLIPETLVFCAAVTLSLSALFSPALLRYRAHDPEGGGILRAPAAVATGFDIWLTRLTIVLFVMVESFQYMTLLFSDWHKVSMACRYVRHPRWRMQPILERLLGFMCSVKLTTRYWSNSVGQYSLLDACLQSQNSLVARVPFLPKRIRGCPDPELDRDSQGSSRAGEARCLRVPAIREIVFRS